MTTFVQKAESFLKSAEQDVAKVLGFAAAVEPVAANIADAVVTAVGHPEVGAAIAKIGSVVVGAGALVTTVSGASGSGADKLSVAAPLVEQLITNSGFLGTRAVADVDKWQAAIKLITGAVADLYDATTAKPAATPAASASAATA
jgi:hypothetical protein